MRIPDSIRVPIGSALLLGAVTAVWFVASRTWSIIPSPFETVVRLFSDLGNGALTPHIKVSAMEAVTAFAGSVAVGVPIGLALGVSPFWRSVVEPILLSTNAIPKIVFLPIIVSIFRIGPRTAVVMGIVIGAFPLIINIMSAIKNMKPIYAKMGRAYCFRPLDMFGKIYVPATLHPFVVGTRLSFSLSVVGVILAELFASKEGIGQVVRQSYSLGMYDRMLAGIILLFVLSLSGSLLIWTIEKKLRYYS